MILVLGASSFIGRHFFEVQGKNAIGTHMRNPIPGTVFYDATRMRLPDILPVDTKISQAIIFYGITEVDQCKRDIERSNEINVESIKLIINDLVEYKIKPVFISSEYVFNGLKGNYREGDKADPVTVYGAQKLEIEEFLVRHCKDYVILRLAKVFGTDPSSATILSKWLEQIRNSEEIYCAYDQVFSPIHVDDVVAMISAVIKLNASGIYHVSNVESCSRLDMLKILSQSLKMNARIVQCSLKDLKFLDNRPLDLSLCPEKIIETTGIRPKSIRSCCEEFSSQIKSNSLARE
ncbi:MAG: hypothetical protein A3C36_01100 [Omnitrophica WOR_2 bacterium RIFCSPHIGHO2_02_FULL_52_10]|nr:MAG: hypothetical protein A3C36_01100 [Omnitrophica WOR_2 bacterium RIFCSPHIGHO2_02_FULL_52_10]